VVEEIVRAARDLKTDLIVMGEGSIAGERVEGAKTVAEDTLQNAPCPVLIVRESGAELLKRRKT
jgi:nucleotide-binding universal stress UspA family protein